MRLIIVLALVIVTMPLQAQLSGKATMVVDGDSFTLFMINKSQIRIELYGIDCPERGQEFFRKSKEYLTKLIANKDVRVKKIETDSNGRTLAIITVGKKIVNEELLKAGLAWRIESDQNPGWADLEATAKEKKLGIWSLTSPVSPWEWRRTR